MDSSIVSNSSGFRSVLHINTKATIIANKIRALHVSIIDKIRVECTDCASPAINSLQRILMISSLFEMCEDLVLTKQIVIGHLAQRLAKQSEKKTHHWEVFMYSPDGEDLAKWIDHVTFVLHETFVPPERTLYKEPYKVHEDGWGEFEVQVKIAPKGGAPPFILMHFISFPEAQSVNPTRVERSTINVVIRNPTPILYEGLTAAPLAWNRFRKIKKQQHGDDVDIADVPTCDPTFEKKWLENVTSVSVKIRNEIRALSDQHKALLNRIQTLLSEIEQTSPDVSEAASLFL